MAKKNRVDQNQVPIGASFDLEHLRLQQQMIPAVRKTNTFGPPGRDGEDGADASMGALNTPPPALMPQMIQFIPGRDGEDGDDAPIVPGPAGPAGAAGGGGGSAVGFSSNKNAVNQTGVADATPTKITMTTEAFDAGGYYDAANSKWTPPAGMITLSAIVYITGSITASQANSVSVYKNGVQLHQSILQTSSGTRSAIGIDITVMDVANGTDYYELYCFIRVSGTGTVNGGVTNTNFCGHWIGP